MSEDLKKSSNTAFVIVRVAEELAAQMDANCLREIETEFMLSGEKVSLRMKAS